VVRKAPGWCVTRWSFLCLMACSRVRTIKARSSPRSICWAHWSHGLRISAVIWCESLHGCFHHTEVVGLPSWQRARAVREPVMAQQRTHGSSLRNPWEPQTRATHHSQDTCVSGRSHATLGSTGKRARGAGCWPFAFSCVGVGAALVCLRRLTTTRESVK